MPLMLVTTAEGMVTASAWPIPKTGISDNPSHQNELGPERHNARTTDGLWVRISQRVPAINTAIWHNRHTDH